MGSMSEVFGRKKSEFLFSVDPVSSMSEMSQNMKEQDTPPYAF